MKKIWEKFLIANTWKQLLYERTYKEMNRQPTDLCIWLPKANLKEEQIHIKRKIRKYIIKGHNIRIIKVTTRHLSLERPWFQMQKILSKIDDVQYKTSWKELLMFCILFLQWTKIGMINYSQLFWKGSLAHI